MSKGRNSVIEILRFVFSIVVVMVHSHGFINPEKEYPFRGGYIAVEFFLIVMGYLMAVKCINSDEKVSSGKYAADYTFRKLLQWLPLVAAVCTVHYIFLFITGSVEKNALPYAVYEILLLPQSGIYNTFYMLPLWYLSAVLICIPIIAYLLKKKSDFFMNIGTFFIPLLIYGYICRTYGDIDIWDRYGIIYIGVLRAAAGICMGINSYKLSQYIKGRTLSGRKKIFLWTAAFVMLSAVLLYTYFFAFTYADYMLIILITAAVAVIFALPEPKLPRAINAIALFLGELSFPIYCGHWTVRAFLRYNRNGRTYGEIVPVYIILSLLYGVILMFILKGLKRLKRRVR